MDVVAHCDCHAVNHRGLGRFLEITGDSTPLRVLAIKVFGGVTMMRRNVRELRREEPNCRTFSCAEPVSRMPNCCIAPHGLRRDASVLADDREGLVALDVVQEPRGQKYRLPVTCASTTRMWTGPTGAAVLATAFNSERFRAWLSGQGTKSAAYRDLVEDPTRQGFPWNGRRRRERSFSKILAGGRSVAVKALQRIALQVRGPAIDPRREQVRRITQEVPLQVLQGREVDSAQFDVDKMKLKRRARSPGYVTRSATSADQQRDYDFARVWSLRGCLRPPVQAGWVEWTLEQPAYHNGRRAVSARLLYTVNSVAVPQN